MFAASKENTLIWLLQDETELVMTSMTTNHYVACCGSGQCSLLSATFFLFFIFLFFYFLISLCFTAHPFLSTVRKPKSCHSGFFRARYFSGLKKKLSPSTRVLSVFLCSHPISLLLLLELNGKLYLPIQLSNKFPTLP